MSADRFFFLIFFSFEVKYKKSWSIF